MQILLTLTTRLNQVDLAVLVLVVVVLLID